MSLVVKCATVIPLYHVVLTRQVGFIAHISKNMRLVEITSDDLVRHVASTSKSRHIHVRLNKLIIH